MNVAVVALLATFTCASGLRVNLESKNNYAYVTMAFDILRLNWTERMQVVRPTTSQIPFSKNPYVDRSGTVQFDREPHHGLGFQGAEGLAKQLREKGAKYPLLVLTNFPEKLAAGVNSSHPNLIPIDMMGYFRGRNCSAVHGYEGTLQKILLWNIEGYDRLMWLDTDVTITRSPDDALRTMAPKGGVMSMRNDPWCDYTPDFLQPLNAKIRIHDGMNASTHHVYMYRNTTSHDLASWTMVFEPNKQDFEGMVALSKELAFCATDQDLVAEYFWRKSETDQHELVQWFPPEVALWGRCTRGEYQTKSSVPVLIHKRRARGFQIR